MHNHNLVFKDYNDSLKPIAYNTLFLALNVH